VLLIWIQNNGRASNWPSSQHGPRHWNLFPLHIDEQWWQIIIKMFNYTGIKNLFRINCSWKWRANVEETRNIRQDLGKTFKPSTAHATDISLFVSSTIDNLETNIQDVGRPTHSGNVGCRCWSGWQIQKLSSQLPVSWLRVVSFLRKSMQRFRNETAAWLVDSYFAKWPNREK